MNSQLHACKASDLSLSHIPGSLTDEFVKVEISEEHIKKFGLGSTFGESKGGREGLGWGTINTVQGLLSVLSSGIIPIFPPPLLGKIL